MAGDPLDLRGVCPDPVVIQTSWFPESTHGGLFQLLGPKPKVDAEKKRITGRLVARGADTGVGLEIRAGGPALGYQQVPAQVYLDKTITLGQVASEEAVAYAVEQPTLAVVAPLEIDPLAIIWDPATYPEWNIIADIGQTDATVYSYEGAANTEYLVQSGILRRSQINGSYDGSPSAFVAAAGKAAVGGFVTNEVYLYEHEVKAWGKPVAYQLVHETGYPNYRSTLAIRSAEKDELAGCLAKLVPALQWGQVKFMADPEPVLRLIVDTAKRYKGGFVYSMGLSRYGAQAMRDLGIVDNGPTTPATLGDFDPARLQRMIDIMQPIIQAQRKPTKPGLRPEDIATNEFIDERVGLPRPH
jgi:hypothetical protein